MSDASKLAEAINNELNELHDQTVSDNPFSWSDSAEDCKVRAKKFQNVSKKFAAFVYVPKTATIVKILVFGSGLPLLILAGLFFANIPAQEDMQLWVWGGLAAVAAVSVMAAAVIADDPDIDEALSLAAYTVPRGWSFSSDNRHEVWEKYLERFDYFNQGDENQYIGTRLWGYADKDKKRPFQLFHFHYDEVRYETEFYRDSKGNLHSRQVRKVYPHDRHGMFISMPESKVRFRVTETCDSADLDICIKLEYSSLNKAVSVYCDKENELAVTKFLSPAVQETIMRLSNEIDGLHIDFYPKLAMVVTSQDFFDNVHGIELDEQAPKFLELIQPAGNRIEEFRTYLAHNFAEITKYNDNY